MAGKTTKDAIPALDLPPVEWRKSSYSNDQGDTCVEVTVHAGQVLVRDSKDRDGPALTFTPSEWRAFVNGVKAGEFELS